MLPSVRIGTWNLAGRWAPRHQELLLGHDVDVWLLTEVSERVVLDGYGCHATRSRMAARRHWAAVFASGGLTPHEDPHPASAAATVDLAAPTSVVSHRIDGIRSIDHVAVRADRPVHSVTRCDATGLSDHDAYVVDLG